MCVGTRYGQLVVERYINSDHVLVNCDCGRDHCTASSSLRKGDCRSCGCLLRAASRERAVTHGMSDSPEYKIWGSIKDRIFNPNSNNWKHYGGRGLTMEPAWADSFEAFYRDVGPRPAGNLSIDRIDNDLGYVRGNVRWATNLQQAANRRPPSGWSRRAS